MIVTCKRAEAPTLRINVDYGQAHPLNPKAHVYVLKFLSSLTPESQVTHLGQGEQKLSPQATPRSFLPAKQQSNGWSTAAWWSSPIITGRKAAAYMATSFRNVVSNMQSPDHSHWTVIFQVAARAQHKVTSKSATAKWANSRTERDGAGWVAAVSLTTPRPGSLQPKSKQHDSHSSHLGGNWEGGQLCRPSTSTPDPTQTSSPAADDPQGVTLPADIADLEKKGAGRWSVGLKRWAASVSSSS